jgi:signal transduction histidine kinase
MTLTQRARPSPRLSPARVGLAAIVDAHPDDAALRLEPGAAGSSRRDAGSAPRRLVAVPDVDAWLDALIRAQEDERRRIARDLHDAIGQALTVIKLDLLSLQRRLADDLALAESITSVDRAIVEIQRITSDLRPAVLDDLGLIPALRWSLASQAEASGFEGRLSAGRLPALSPTIETVCYRIAQEALTNIARHSQASVVAMAITVRAGHVILTIHDDGVGFDTGRVGQSPMAERLGLLGIQERARLLGGVATIRSWPDRGTVVRARLPMEGTLGVARARAAVAS